VSISGLASINLQHALPEAGCPLCRCCLNGETRYIKNLLWENVNDVGTRLRLAASLGFCHRHAQQMHLMERDEMGMMLGNSIIYEDLIHQVLEKLRATHRDVIDQVAQSNRIRRLLASIGKGYRRKTRERSRLLIPTGTCRVCEMGSETGRYYCSVLTEMLALERYQKMYEASDGVCLPHLRVILEQSRSDIGLEYILSQTEQRLTGLRKNLYGLAQSYRVDHPQVPRSESELSSVEKAVAFLTSPVMVTSSK
jgi:hypothetical protein